MTIRFALILLPALVLIQPPSTKAAGDWDFVLAPYFLAPTIEGDASAGRFLNGAEVDIDTRDILEALDLGGMIHAEVRHSSGLGAIVDYSFMDLSSEAAGPLLPGTTIEGDVFQGVLEAYGSYRFDLRDHKLDLYAGIRWWDIDVEVSRRGAPGPNELLDSGDDWVDPVIGARWVSEWWPGWRTSLAADLGGFVVGSDFSASAQALAIYDAWENVSFALGYRVLSVDYDNDESGTPGFFAYDTVTHGPMAGVLLRF